MAYPYRIVQEALEKVFKKRSQLLAALIALGNGVEVEPRKRGLGSKRDPYVLRLHSGAVVARYFVRIQQDAEPELNIDGTPEFLAALRAVAQRDGGADMH